VGPGAQTQERPTSTFGGAILGRERHDGPGPPHPGDAVGAGTLGAIGQAGPNSPFTAQVSESRCAQNPSTFAGAGTARCRLITLEQPMHLSSFLAVSVFIASSSASASEVLRLDPSLIAGVAATAGIAPGDLLVDVNQQATHGVVPVLVDGQGAVAAQQRVRGGSFGVGLQVGSPTAVTVKFGGPHQSGVVLGVGAGFGFGERFAASLWLHADYLFHLATLLDTDGLGLSLYAGPGLFASFFGSNYGFGYRDEPYYRNFDNVGFGVRLPIGLSLAFDVVPLELYMQFDPALSVFPGLGFGLGGSVGFRVYF
jgi:hypothetical protein